jgi:hypothetical protein
MTTSFKTLTLYAAQIADGASTMLKTVTREDGSSTGGRSELVVITVSGTWSAVTVTPQISLDYGTSSPATWVAVKVVATDGTLSDVAMTASGAFELQIPTGVHFRLNVSGSASPLPSLNALAHGDIETA